MIRIFFLFLFIPFLIIAQTPTWQWANGWEKNFSVKDIAVNSSGESYIIDDFLSTFIIGNDTVSFSNCTNCSQSYIAKLDANGNYLWYYPVLSNSGGFVTSSEIKIDNNGNIYALFGYKQTNSSTTVFKLIKLDSSGNLLNEYNSGGPIMHSLSLSLSLDFNEEPIVTSQLNGGPWSLNGNSYINSLLVINFDQNLNINWIYSVDPVTTPGVNSFQISFPEIVVNENSGEIIITSGLYSQANFSGNIMGVANTGGNDHSIILRLDQNGNFISVATLGFLPQELAMRNNYIYATGGVSSVNPFGITPIAGGPDILVACIDNNNQIVWAKNFGTSGNDSGMDIVIDDFDNIYITGNIGNYTTTTTAYFDTIQVTTYGGQYVASLDLNGDVNWLEVQDAQNLGTAEFQCIDTDNNGGLYLAGYTSPVLFGSLNLDGNLIPSNPSTSQHIVVAKLGNYFPPTAGCTDSTATNYDSSATIDDGSCCYTEIIEGDNTICLGDSISLSVNVVDTIINGFTYGGSFNGNCYFVSNNAMNWIEADSICSANNGHLAIINSFSEDSFVTNITPNHLWIGLKQDSSSSSQTSSQVIPRKFGWEWLDGTPLLYDSISSSWNSYQNWDAPQPDNGHPAIQENYGHIYSGSISNTIPRKWNDLEAFNSATGFQCHALLEIENCVSPSILWSTNDTTSSIQVSPGITTDYWVQTTQNGVTCIDTITITIGINGCTDSSAFNYNPNAECDDGSCTYISPNLITQNDTSICCNDTLVLLADSSFIDSLLQLNQTSSNLSSLNPTWDWATGWATNYNGLQDIAVNDLGESYVMGHFGIGNSSGQIIFNDTYSGSGAYIAKFDTSGSYLWSYPVIITGQGTNSGALDLDNNGNVIASFTGNSSQDTAKIIKLDANGYLINEMSFAWSNGVPSMFVNSLETDANNNIFIVFNQVHPVLGTAMFLRKYDQNLNLIWERVASVSNNAPTNGNIFNFTLTTDYTNNVIVHGLFSGIASFDGNTITSTGSTNARNNFFVKYDENGNLIWLNSYPSSGAQPGFQPDIYKIQVDESGNIYGLGGTTCTQFSFNGTNYNNSDPQIWLLKLDPNGQELWSHLAGQVGATQSYEWGFDMCIRENNLFITGQLGNSGSSLSTAIFDTIQTNALGNLFVASYSLDGNVQWVKTQQSATLGSAYFFGIDSDQNGNLYLAGTSINHVYGDLNLDGNIVSSNNVPGYTYELSLIAKLANAFTPPNNIQYIWSTGDTTSSVSLVSCDDTTISLEISYNNSSYFDSIAIYIIPCCDSLGTNQNITICDGDSVIVGNSTYTISGTFTDTLSTSNGCDSIITTNLTVNNPPNSGISNSQSFCINVFDSSDVYNLNNLLIGQDPGGVWLFNGIPIPGIISPLLYSIGVHSFTYEVFGASPCSNATTTVTLTLFESPDISSTSTDVSCFGFCDGLAISNVISGVPPYVYNWSNGNISSTINNLCAGSYSVEVTDINGCTDTDTIVINQPDEILTISSVQDVSCYGDSTGSVNLQITGGTVPYSTDWFGVNPNALPAGVFSYEVTDANGCLTIGSVTITQPDEILFSATTQDVSCYGWSNGSAYGTTIGGVPPYSYQWSNGSTLDSIYNLGVGTYTVDVTDNIGCVIYGSVNINEPDEIIISSVTTNTSCFDSTDGSVDVTVSGGILPYSYLWSSGDVTDDLYNMPAGNYSLTVIDSENCESILNIIIDQPQLIEISSIIISSSCVESSDGSIDITVSGGTSAYSYLWNPGSQITEDLTDLYTGTYLVTVTDFNGCSDTASFFVNTGVGLEDCFFIPSGFTPNGDGYNESWEIDGIDLFPDITVQVFNRWGQLLFESTGYTTMWDGTYNGKECAIGTYYYIVNLNDGREPYKGTVNIKR